MDFIVGLPRTQRGNGSTLWLLIVSLKWLISFHARKQWILPILLIFIFKEVVEHHGVLKSIVSDRNTKFFSHFGRHLWKRICINLLCSSAYYHQTNGKTKVVSRKLGNLLNSLSTKKPKQGDSILPQAEFAYSSSVNHST